MKSKLRLLKAFFIVLFFLAAAITLLSLVIPGRVVVTKSAEIFSTPEIVMDSVNNLQTWKNWYPVIVAYKAEITDIKTSATSISWMYRGKQSGVEILEQQKNAIRFLYKTDGNPDVENMITCFVIEHKPNTANVEWTAVTKLKWYPWEKFSGLFIEKVTGSGYEYGLAELNKMMKKD